MVAVKRIQARCNNNLFLQRYAFFPLFSRRGLFIDNVMLIFSDIGISRNLPQVEVAEEFIPHLVAKFPVARAGIFIFIIIITTTTSSGLAPFRD